jgi:hypothetical protein
MTKVCARCGKDMKSYTVSFFNLDEICGLCREIERRHPLYAEARRSERSHVEAGDLGFQGIGLPAGYAEWAEAARRATG